MSLRAVTRAVIEVRHGSLQPARRSPDPAGGDVDVEVDADGAGVDLCAGDGRRHEVRQLDLLTGGFGRLPASELHHVGHELGQLVDLGQGVAAQGLPVRRVQLPGSLQDFDVGPQAREWGPELMGGVGDELCLQ